MNEDWFAQIESKVFTQVSYMLTEREDAPFPNMKCTTVSQNTVVNFPTMYLHELQPVEAGNDLDNTTVNAVLSTMEVMVWSNESEKHCKDIMAAVILEMKKLRYNVTMFPVVQTDSKIAKGVARFRRMIGAGDSFI